jgi:C1A family cysteine protease
MNQMRKNTLWIVAILLVVSWTGCEAFLDFNPEDLVSTDTVEEPVDDNNDGNGGGGGNDDGNDDGNNNELTVELSENDPQNTGSCDDTATRSSGSLIELMEIPMDLPQDYDLSEYMPPVRSQGNQGSCVSWATAYYLKSYQEKKQYGYEYETFDDVMSPAFVYNQSANGNCGAGSMVLGALHILQTQGVTTWSDFPYDDDICSEQPDENHLRLAKENKIGDYFIVDVPEEVPHEEYTKINLMKTLLTQDNPIVMSFSIKEVNFYYRNTTNNDFIGLTFTPDSTVVCGHAVLVVGYDDNLEAFKFVNSWGSYWGNDGYAWLSYKFFLPQDHPDYIEGVDGTVVAYDETNDEI